MEPSPKRWPEQNPMPPGRQGGRGGRPIAILGDAPCLDDIVDVELLMESRYVIAINGACNRMPFHALCVADPVARIFLNHLISGHHLMISSVALRELVGCSGALRRRRRIRPEAQFLWGHNGTTEVMPSDLLWRNPQGTINVLMAHLARFHGIEEVELYGIDMEGHYENQLANLKEDSAIIKPTCCCPTSKLPTWVDRNTPPWCEEERTR